MEYVRPEPTAITPDLLARVARLPKPQRTRVMAHLGAQEFQRCADDPLYWLDASLHVRTAQYPDGLPYLFTKDPHKIYTCNLCGGEVNEERRADHLELTHGYEGAIPVKELRDNFTILPAVRQFPNTAIMEYVPPIVEAWQSSQYFAMEKSRDMSATWLLIALHTWDAMFHSGRQQILQSEDAFKTLELVQRSYLIYDATPRLLKDAIGPATFSKGTTKSGELYFNKQGSEILGLPQGADQIRQFHPSSIFADEAAFQNEAGATFAAIKPAIQQGGRYSAISSANRSWFEMLVRDRTDD